MSQSDLMLDLIKVGDFGLHLWFSDFALYHEDYLMYKHNTLG